VRWLEDCNPDQAAYCIQAKYLSHSLFMQDLLNQCRGLFNAAIDREISRRQRPVEAPLASVPGDGDMMSLRPDTATPLPEHETVVNAGDVNPTGG